MTLAAVFEAMNGGCHPFPKLAGTVMLLLMLLKTSEILLFVVVTRGSGGGENCICFFGKNMELYGIYRGTCACF